LYAADETAVLFCQCVGAASVSYGAYQNQHSARSIRASILGIHQLDASGGTPIHLLDRNINQTALALERDQFSTAQIVFLRPTSTEPATVRSEATKHGSCTRPPRLFVTLI
jgi:hypothetical protein